MRYHAFVTDYDGTLAQDGRVDAETIEALERLRSSGRRRILVTGRQLPELAETFERLDLFDLVVVENGAVLFDPATREEEVLCERPPDAFIVALRSRGVSPLSVGRAIVATWEPNETAVLETIREMGLELEIIFNKGAVMVLPSGINKASGLAAALGRLGLSPHNAVAIGDAQNDHAFLSICEASVAVANSLPMLKERADLVTDGERGAGVTELIDALLRDDLASLDDRLTRHRLHIGTGVDEQPASLAPFGATVLLAGPSGAGKSTLTTTILEEIGAHAYQFCLIDPEGDHNGFPGAVTLGAPSGGPTVEEVLEVLTDPTTSAVVDLVGLPLTERPEFFEALLPRIHDLQGRFGRPHWIIVDEAHHLMPATWESTPSPFPDELGATLLVVLDPGRLSRAALDSVDEVIAVGDEPSETLEAFASATGRDSAPRRERKPEGASAMIWRVDDGPGETMSVKVRSPRFEQERHRRKYAEGELSADRSFYFRGPDGRLNLRAQNLEIFVQIAEGVDDETWLHHLRRREYSSWIRKIVKDEDLADAVARVEADADADVDPETTRQRIREAIEARYTAPV